MGTWNISIDGHGCHHNSRADIDADLAAKEFIEKLKAQGHQIKRADFTLTGQTESLLPSEEKKADEK